MENYFDKPNKDNCNGCGVCALKCPKGAIKMILDEEGFYYPKVEESKCINCGMCKKICSNNPSQNHYANKVYAAMNKNDAQRANSASGGIFKILCEYIIDKKGVIYGVILDDTLNVRHSRATTVLEASNFSNSKYVRSFLGNTFNKVEQDLQKGKVVLFSGTPCQNYALKKYLGKEWDNLLLCEIVCHSNPSPKIFQLYKRNIELKSGKTIRNYYFRSKNPKVNNKPYAILEDNKLINTELYNKAFDKMLISRPSCSSCQFCTTNRKADITIGDFWGIDKFHKDFNDNRGISLICINSDKGLNVFETIKSKLLYIESSIDKAFQYNHNSNVPMNKNREKFFKGIIEGKITELNIDKYMEKYTNRTVLERILDKGKRKLKKYISLKKQ